MSKYADHPGSAVVIGEALVDVVRRPGDTTEHAGGSPANVAFGLSRLGIRTRLETQLAEDRLGDLVRRHLEDAGVEVATSGQIPQTATAIASIDSNGAAEYRFDISWSPQPIRVQADVRVVHTGSIAIFLAPGAEVVYSALQEARASALISVDPNIRPALVGDHRSALVAFERIAGHAHLVKMSDEDAAWLYPGAPIEEVLARILGLGPELVVATRGAEGSLLRTSDFSVDVAAPRVAVVDTIGAGDSFMSALIAGLVGLSISHLSEGDLRRLGIRASTAAAITVSRAGAMPPTLVELEQALARA